MRRSIALAVGTGTAVVPEEATTMMTPAAHEVRLHTNELDCPCLLAGFLRRCPEHGEVVYSIRHAPDYVARARKDEGGHP